MKTDSSPNGVSPELWGYIRLLEKLIRLARQDAMKGDVSAISFMDIVCPSWRKGELLKNAEKIK